MSVSVTREDEITIVAIDRPDRRNAVDSPTAHALYDAFKAFDADDTASVAILTGTGGNFCAGAELKAIAAADGGGNPVRREGDLGPMGPTRLMLSKPVIAAVEGFAVAGGLELSLWCDLRVAGRSATFGVYCRRFGVPLIDLGTIRLPRLIGQSRAMDMILTGRGVPAEEAQAMGLANRVVEDGQALTAAIALAKQIAVFPQGCMRNDRRSALDQWSLDWDAATAREIALGNETLSSGETLAGATRFAGGQGRGGTFS